MNRFSFTAADVKRAIKAGEASGKQIAAVDFARKGGFRLLIGDPLVLEVPPLVGKNEWDDIL